MSISRGQIEPAIALGLIMCVLIVPLWCVNSPGMPDYPAHLAGFAMIAGNSRLPPVSSFYSIHWVLVPNLASELIVPVLAKLLSLEAATRIFLSAAVAMWVLGPAAIQRALFGRIGVESLAAAFFAYNTNFMWGFFNYYFAAGLCFIIFAAWIATAKKRSPAALAGFALAICALYVCHLFAVALLVVMIGCFEAAQIWIARDLDFRKLAARALPIFLIFLPAAIAFLFLRPTGGDGGKFAFDFADTIADRFSAAIKLYYDKPAYLLISAFAILWLWGLLYDRIRVHPAMKICLIVLAVLTLIAPEWALGGWGVQLRLPGVLGAMLFASAELRLDSRVAALFTAALLLLACVNSALLAQNWRGYDRQYSEFRAALRDIPTGSKIMTAVDGNSMATDSDSIPEQPYWHMAEFAIIDRGAFTPLMFTTKGQHVVQINPPYDRLAAGSAQQGAPPDISELDDLASGSDDDDPDIEKSFPYLRFFPCHFDEVVIVRGTGKAGDFPDFLTLRHAGSFFSLYDIHPTASCAKR